ncbi:uncharacterized protein BDV17DRAFT_254853 [Aspergillus undulatus]|uniref:uncharacterized protein n=1 Tax=Aspergillus undulatus TaxID=1810928 RepID=UPI003CCD4154
MAGTTVLTTASNPTGRGETAFLRAIIDDTVAENIISSKRLEQLQNELQLSIHALGSDKTLRDSNNTSYIARNKVLLLMKPRDGLVTEALYFYAAESESLHISGRNDIILAKSWNVKFPAKDQDGRSTYAAPTEILKGDSRIDRKEWNRKAAENEKENYKRAAEVEAVFEKLSREQKEKGKQPARR